MILVSAERWSACGSDVDGHMLLSLLLLLALALATGTGHWHWPDQCRCRDHCSRLQARNTTRKLLISRSLFSLCACCVLRAGMMRVCCDFDLDVVSLPSSSTARWSFRACFCSLRVDTRHPGKDKPSFEAPSSFSRPRAEVVEASVLVLPVAALIVCTGAKVFGVLSSSLPHP